MRVYGMNVLKELDTKKIKKVFTSRKEVCKYCSENKIKYEFVDNHFLNKMCEYNHQGVVIDAFDYDYYNINDIDGDFVLILDHLEDPHNFGAIIRSCEAFGVDAIIIPNDRSVDITGTVVKASVGTIEKVKIIKVTNLNNTIKKLKDYGYWVVGTDMEGTVYTDIDYKMKTALIIGNEGKGISRLVSENCDYLAKIPMSGTVNSLNASVACGIFLAEINRSRGV